MSDVLEGLKRAKELIERGWTQNTLARATDGAPTATFAEDAVSFCISGACVRGAMEIGLPVWKLDGAIEAALRKHGYHRRIANWNDQPKRTKEEVLALMEEAIRDAKE